MLADFVTSINKQKRLLTSIKSLLPIPYRMHIVAALNGCRDTRDFCGTGLIVFLAAHLFAFHPSIHEFVPTISMRRKAEVDSPSADTYKHLGFMKFIPLAFSFLVIHFTSSEAISIISTGVTF